MAALLALALTVHGAAACEPHQITAYAASEYPGLTADGTTTTVDALARGEPIAAADYHWPLGSYVEVEGLGVYRIADRGHLGARHIDVLVATRAQAFEITSVRTVCPVEAGS